MTIKTQETPLKGHSIRAKKTGEEKAKEMGILIAYIKKHQPVSMWKLAKETDIPNSSLFYKIRDLTFAGVVYSKLKVNENGHPVRLIYTAKND